MVLGRWVGVSLDAARVFLDLARILGFVGFGLDISGGRRVDCVPGTPLIFSLLMSFTISLDFFKVTSGSSSHLCKLLSALKNLGCSVDTCQQEFVQ